MITINTTSGQRQIDLLILDRDGVINENSKVYPSPLYYILTPADFIFKTGVLAAFRYLHKLDANICICTKQLAVGKGILGDDDLGLIHAYMSAQLLMFQGRRIDAIFVETTKKSKADILKQALKRFSCHPAKALFLDDSEENLRDAQKIGINGVLISDENNLLKVVSFLLEGKIISVIEGCGNGALEHRIDGVME